MKKLVEFLKDKDLVAESRRAHWCTKTLAQLWKCSPREIERYFKQQFAQTPHRWMLSKRLEPAHDLLRSGLNVFETSEKLGFENQHHFSREFKKAFGHSPNEVRKQPKGEKPLP